MQVIALPRDDLQPRPVDRYLDLAELLGIERGVPRPVSERIEVGAILDGGLDLHIHIVASVEGAAAGRLRQLVELVVPPEGIDH